MAVFSRVIVSKDLAEFFRGEVVSAQQDLGVQVSDLCEYYLVNLLCEYSRTDKPEQQTVGHEPLAILYQRALQSLPTEKQHLLKQLGDVALYGAGFFSDFVEHSTVDIDYYISMGGSAYGNLAGMLSQQNHGDTFSVLYRQLSVRFTELVDVLNHISQRAASGQDTPLDVLRVYNRWLRTGSERARKQLQSHGILLTSGLPTDYNQ